MRKHYRIREVARMVGISYWTLTAYCTKGLVECSVTPGGGCYVMNLDQINKLVEKMERKPDASKIPQAEV